MTGERTALQAAIDMGMHRGVNRKLRELGRGGFATVHPDIYGRYLDELITEGVIDAADVRKMVELAIVEQVLELYRAQQRDVSNLRHHIEQLNKRVDSLALHQLLESWPDHAEEDMPALVELEQLVAEAMECDRWA